jgi:hypothetical protein
MIGMNSEITLMESISMLGAFSPVKVMFNGIVLYDDYDGDETGPLQEVLPKRLWQAKNYVVTDINIKIVEFHHSVVSIKGRYEPCGEMRICNDR